MPKRKRKRRLLKMATQEIILDALRDFRRWLVPNDPDDKDKLKRIDEAIARIERN